MDAVNQLQILIPIAILLGVGDAVFNTQIYGILGYVFTGSSEAAFATFKFYQSASTGVLFFCEPLLQLTKHLPVLIFFFFFFLVGNSMLTTSPENPDVKYPNMVIWFPVLVVPLVLGMVCIFWLRFKGIPLDARSKK